jgi:hypothetical protein
LTRTADLALGESIGIWTGAPDRGGESDRRIVEAAGALAHARCRVAIHHAGRKGPGLRQDRGQARRRGRTVTVCCARRTGGPSSAVCVGTHTTPRTSMHTACLELTRTSLSHFSEATYRILHGAVYALWNPKHLPIAIAVRRGLQRSQM